MIQPTRSIAIDSVKVGPLEYPVFVVENLASPEGENLLGELVYKDARIMLDPDQDENVQVLTLWHEIMHAILMQTGHCRDDDEGLADALSFAIVQLLRDNPTLFSITAAQAISEPDSEVGEHSIA